MGGAKVGRKKEQKYVFNVGGMRHETYRATLYSVPNTRLYSIAKKNPRDAEEFDSDCREFFFDRHPGAFEQIINFYRTGKLHCPMDICGPMFEEELRYWGIEEKLIEPCCWMNYIKHRDAEASMNLFDGTTSEHNSSDEEAEDDELTSTAAKFGMSEVVTKKQKTRWERVKPKMWRLIDDPYSSFGANIITLISMTFIVVSIMGFCLETHRWGRTPVATPPVSDSSTPSPSSTDTSVPSQDSVILSAMTILQSTVSTSAPTTTADPFGIMHNPNQFEDLPPGLPGPMFPPMPPPREKTVPKKVLTILDYVCSIWFTFEFITRLIFCPDRILFFKTMLNLIDLLAIVPFYVQILADKTDIVVSMWEIIKILRIFRVFKLCRHVIGLKVLVHTLRASARELILLILFLVLGVIIFSSLLHYAEFIQQTEDKRLYSNFDSIPSGFWWAVITMTTIGYGDHVPETISGRIVGALCAICGVLTISLPVPVIVNNFTLYYNHAQARLKLPPKKRRHVDRLAGAAEALKQQEEDELKEGGLSFDDQYSEHHPAFEGETGFESELDPDKTSLAPHSASSTKKHFTNSPQPSIKFSDKSGGGSKVRKPKQVSGLFAPNNPPLPPNPRSARSAPQGAGGAAADSIFITCGSDADSDPDLQLKGCDFRGGPNVFQNSRHNLAGATPLAGSQSTERSSPNSNNLLHSANGPVFPSISQTSIHTSQDQLFQFSLVRPSTLDVRKSQLELHHEDPGGVGGLGGMRSSPSSNSIQRPAERKTNDTLSPTMALPRSPSLHGSRNVSRRNSFIPRSLTSEMNSSSPQLANQSPREGHSGSTAYNHQLSVQSQSPSPHSNNRSPFLHPTTLTADETSLTATNSYKGHSQLTPPGHSCRGEEYPKGRRRRRRGEGKVRPGVEGGLNSKDQDSDDHRTHSSSNSSDCQSCSADENEPLTFPFIGQ